MKTVSVDGIVFNLVNASGYFTYPNYQKLLDYLKNNLGKHYSALEVPTTKELNPYILNQLYNLPYSNCLRIRVVGGYDDEKLKYGNDFLTKDNVYKVKEMKDIMVEIQNIEKGLNPNWDHLQKIMYFIGYLKNKIIYHPFFETAPSKDIRSLTGLVSGKTVCAGYALILKELCDRNGIDCQLVFGCCSEKDYKEGHRTTHAWNIVKINGQYVPVDLTWNAQSNNRGRMLDIGDLFNVNEFVKSHIPAQHERITDYKRELKSIDGHVVRTLNGLINKDMVYDNTTLFGDRKDGTRYRITLVDELVVENKSMFRYVYQRVDSSGKLGVPVIIYCSNNINGIVNAINQIEKIKKQAQDELRRGNREKYNELMEKVSIEKTRYIREAYDKIDDLLFSRTNLQKSLERKDYYIGGFASKYDRDGHLSLDGVEIDPEIGEKNKKQQKTCVRSDGTSFVIEDYGKLKLSNYGEVFRYRIYEPVMENGKYVVKKNTIFTDEDLMLDNRRTMYDDFLSRSRLDRKTVESNGYLGYYSKEGVRTYSTPATKFFKEDLCKNYRVGLQHMKKYYEDLTFSEMKRLISTYEKVVVSGVTHYRNIVTKREVTDEDLKLRIDFANLWLFAAGLNHTEGDFRYGFSDAFSNESSKFFEYISSIIVHSMNLNGNIDPVAILMNLKENPKYKEKEEIVVRLFSSQEAVQLINKLYRLQNPSAMKEKGFIDYFSNGRMSNAKILLEARKKLLEARKKLEVIANARGEIEVREKAK